MQITEPKKVSIRNRLVVIGAVIAVDLAAVTKVAIEVALVVHVTVVTGVKLRCTKLLVQLVANRVKFRFVPMAQSQYSVVNVLERTALTTAMV